MMPNSSPALVMSRHVAAAPDVVFAAWTDPIQLQRWWGPKGVECTHAEVDLRVGGRFRLANRQTDGSTIWISGVYETVEPPGLLVHTWQMGEEDDAATPERVRVEFRAATDGTEVRVTHSGIEDADRRHMHGQGWVECLDGLATLVSPADGRV